MNITISLTKEEVAALMALMDAGVKSVGFPAARICVVMEHKIAEAQNQKNKEATIQ